ncbi:MAG TPA: hypothetical protein VMD75_09070 [Candidatus Binataceae bacterium]|nr:hypothetical protein [Candidatus Binataceae bacterium]
MNGDGNKHAPGPIEARAGVLDDFEAVDLPTNEVPVVIERDRAHFVGRLGFYRKLLPLCVDGGRVLSGGRYLFASYDQAVDFRRWLGQEFRLDNKLFSERPWARDLTCDPFHVIGAHDFKDVHRSQTVVRVERWAIDGDHDAMLDSTWRALRDRANASGLASAWLWFSDDRKEAAVITVADRIGARDLKAPDEASLRALAARPTFAEELARQSWARKTFDRTSWVLTIWFAPDHEPLYLWPNSPPLPGPAA